MAVKVNNDGRVERVQPQNGTYFNVDMLEQLVGGWPEPTKVGPIWVIINGDATKGPDNYNEIASNFFQIPIYGAVISLSPLELPPEWDLVDDYDRKFTIDESDEGFIDALQSRMFMDPFNSPMSENFQWDPDFPNVSGMGPMPSMKEIFGKPKKDEFFYNPNKPKHPETSDENYENFLKDSYAHIIKCSAENFKEFIVYEDQLNVVKVRSKGDRIKTINQVIKALIKDEDYEKCANLRDILEEKFSETPQK